MENAAAAPLTIVGIGASAGGLTALKQLFRALPPDGGIAYVVVMHLSPSHESHLAELLQPHCSLPVEQVTGTVQLRPDRVYVIPPNANLNTIDTHLRLSELEKRPGAPATIDHFFRTLAETHDGRAIGVLLSGSGSDGTLGLRRVKEEGGVTIVQDPAEAEYDGMPRSAILAGTVDMVLPLKAIPGELIRLARSAPRVPAADEEEGGQDEPHRILQRIFALLRARTGHDFNQYKRSTILRRIARRMQLHHNDTLHDYVEALQEDHDEAQALFQDLLITVTEFFRDEDVFKALEETVLPRLFDNCGPDGSLRVWSVGCSTGEEAYSIGMLLLEEAAKRQSPPRIQIFASDLHERALHMAREGIYPKEISEQVPPDHLHRYFVLEDDRYRVRRELRELVVFAPHNLLSDPPFSRLDLLLCRNVLIYLQRDVQHDVLRLFHYALKPEGILVLGPSETVERSELFSPELRDASIFRRSRGPTPQPHLPAFPLRAMGWRPELSAQPPTPPRRDPGVQGMIHERMVERYAPPSVLVNADHELVHASASAGRYLRFPGGTPPREVQRLVSEPLQLELRALLFAASESGAPQRSRPISLALEGEPHRVVLRVAPATDPELDGYMLVFFDEVPGDPEEEESSGEVDAVRSATIRELETELQLNRRRLQDAIEDYEAGREQMQASNEELQSANEELRSTMEELETSKEELQSMNEELATVNQENRHRVEELGQLADDLQNLLAGTDIGTLFLDRMLRIVRFTPKVTELFHIRATDRGRPLSDLTHTLGYEELHADARTVLDRLAPIEREVRAENGRWHLIRILPYRTAEDQIDGVVITLIDITTRKTTEDALRKSEERYRALVEQVSDYAIFRTDPEGRPVTWNEGVLRVLGLGEEEFIGRDIRSLFTPEDVKAGVPEKELQEAAETGTASNTRWMRRRDGGRFFADGVTSVIRDPEGTLVGFTKVMRDHTELRLAEDALRRNQAQQAFLLRLGDTLRPLTEPADVLATASRLVGEELGANRAFFLRRVEDDWLPAGPFVRDAAPLAPGSHPLSGYGAEMAARLMDGETVEIRNVRSMSRVEPEAREFLESVSTRALLAAPVVRFDRTVGALIVHSSSARGWDRGELTLLAETAERSWSAMERARTEQALAESEERLRLAAEATGFGTYDYDVERREAVWSDQLRAITGYPGENPVPGEAIASMVHPEDRERFVRLVDAALDPDGSGTHDVEYRYVRPDGETVWVHDVGRTWYEGTGESRKAVRVVGTVEGVTERKRQEEQMRFVMAELNHRVRNTLTVVEAMANQTLRHGTVETFAETFGARLRSLSRAHQVLTGAEWRGASLRVLIETELGPELVEAGRVQVEGPELVLEPNAALALHMVLHELSTNAMKHGALSAPEGQVRVAWSVESDSRPEVALEWLESGGPPVSPPERRGFGSQVLERTVSYELGGRTQLEFNPEGVRCLIEFPPGRDGAGENGG